MINPDTPKSKAYLARVARWHDKEKAIIDRAAELEKQKWIASLKKERAVDIQPLRRSPRLAKK